MESPEDPNKFLKLIDLDLERRRNELPDTQHRTIFIWRAVAAAFLVGSIVVAWWLFDFATSARDRSTDPANPTVSVGVPEQDRDNLSSE